MMSLEEIANDKENVALRKTRIIFFTKKITSFLPTF